jgi:RNA-directed DNA polymerase
MCNKINILEIQNKQLLYDLFEAYYDCRKNKRNTVNAISFELNYESNIIKLRDDILSGNYEI